MTAPQPSSSTSSAAKPTPATAALLDSILTSADAHYAREDWAAARDALCLAVELAPNQTQIRAALGSLQYQLQDFAAACGSFTIATSQCPGNPDLHTQLAMTHLKQNQPGPAEVALGHALELRPTDPTALKLLADSRRDRGRYQEAGMIYGGLINKHPDQGGVLLSLAKCFYQLGDREGAEATLEQVLTFDPNNEIARDNLASLKPVAKQTSTGFLPDPNAALCSPKGRMNYASEYNEYWSRANRWGTHSFHDPNVLANQIERTCGRGSLLDVGCGMGLLVRTLVTRGIHASGTDIAHRVVEDGNRELPGRFHAGSILSLPFPDGTFETVSSTDCLEHIAEADVPMALHELHRVCRRFAFIRLATTPDMDGRWHLTIKDRVWWETRFFEAGFRKHPLCQEVTPFDTLKDEGWQITMLLEKIPAPALLKYPLGVLKAERDLHMDMLRESGPRSDAHIARYQLAAKTAPDEGIIVDAACGLGYGSAILAWQHPKATVIGIDNSAAAIRYAREHFAGNLPNLEFHEADACDFGFLGQRQIDFLVSFETIEHIAEPNVFLVEVLRRMSPNACFIGSVPNLWVDDQGNNPSPFHLHVFDYDRIKALFVPHWTEVVVYRQNVERGVKGDHGRILRQVTDDKPSADDLANAEWWIVTAKKQSRATSSSQPVAEIDFTKWLHSAQPGELEYHRNNQWRQSPEFLTHAAQLFNHFGLNAEDYRGKTVIDLGAGSKLRSKHFSESRLIAIEPLANQFMGEIPWCDLKDAHEVYSVPGETRVQECAGRADLLISINVLDHCFNFEAVIQNIHDYLKLDGLAFLSFDSHGVADDMHPLALSAEYCEEVFDRKGMAIARASTGLGTIGVSQSYGHGPHCLNYWLRRTERFGHPSAETTLTSSPVLDPAFEGSSVKATLTNPISRTRPPAVLTPATSQSDWLLMPTGISQLATMVATVRELNADARGAVVLSIISCFTPAMDLALRKASELWGCRYAGNFWKGLNGWQLDPDQLSDEERERWERDPSSVVSARLIELFPELAEYRGVRTVIPARPNMPEDFYFLSALEPSAVHLVADGIQNEVILHNRTGRAWRGFNRELASFPANCDVWCPDYLARDTAGIGNVRVLNAALVSAVYDELARSPLGRHLEKQVLACGELPRAIILSQHFALSQLCSEDEEFAYYSMICDGLQQAGLAPVLFKRHPRDPAAKTERLLATAAKAQLPLICTDDLASCVPIECLKHLWADREIAVVGSSSSAVLGLQSLSHVKAYCADGDFLPDRLRRQIILFSVKNSISRMTLVAPGAGGTQETTPAGAGAAKLPTALRTFLDRATMSAAQGHKVLAELLLEEALINFPESGAALELQRELKTTGTIKKQTATAVPARHDRVGSHYQSAPASSGAPRTEAAVRAMCVAAARQWEVSPEVHSEDFIFRFVCENPCFPSLDKAVGYYFDDGARSARKLRDLLTEKCQLNVDGGNVRLLEFASGYGCVSRHLKKVLPFAELLACDIHPQAVRFVETLGVKTVQSASRPEDLRFERKFDVVFALSFFSHMPKSTFTRWLTTLTAAVKPGGFLIFTTHGLHSIKHIPRCSFDGEGFYFAPMSEQKDLNAAEYGLTVAKTQFVLEQIAKVPGLELQAVHEGFWWEHQDTYIVRKQTPVGNQDGRMAGDLPVEEPPAAPLAEASLSRNRSGSH